MTALEAELKDLFVAAEPFFREELHETIQYAEDEARQELELLVAQLRKLKNAHMARHGPEAPTSTPMPAGLHSGPPLTLHHQMTPLYRPGTQDSFPSAPPPSPSPPSSPVHNSELHLSPSPAASY